MKNLILVRHGKSSWNYAVGDKDRPLKERGISDAHLVAQQWVRQQVPVDALFTSPANRAMHTAIIVSREIGFPTETIRLSDSLYDFSGDQVLRFIKGLDDSLETVMLFGHNHAFTHLANTLGHSYIDNVPTAGLVQLQFPVDRWSQVDQGQTLQTLFPKQLRA